MPITKLTPENNYPYLQERMNALQQSVPEAFADGKINWDILREVLGEELEEPKDEFFGLSWPGKREARKLASIPSRGTLVPVPGEGVNEDETENLFIEGDNLEVLKLLLKSYAGKIKMIYIDPPYNTGNDFIYNDNFTDPLEAYLKYTGAKGEGSELITTNTRADGRFHSNWLNMMYPRLILARQLLCDDGTIFISIDDNEIHNLRQMMNEIFGGEKFIAQFIWKSRQNKDNRNITGVSIDHEYVVCYGKNVRGDERDSTQYNNPDNDPRGPWASANMAGLLPEDLRPNCHYDLINPETGINYGKPKMGWRYDKNTMNRLIAENRILWPSSPSGRPRRKSFLNDLSQEYTGASSIIGEGIYTWHGTKDIENLFGSRVFEFPKPLALIKELLLQGSNENEIVLDFFAGSGTLGNVVFDLLKDRNLRKFICVQVAEVSDRKSQAFKEGYQTIASVCKERLKLAIKTLQEAFIEEQKSTPLLGKSNIDHYLGFKVFEYSRSNFKNWISSQDVDKDSIKTLFDDQSNPLMLDWKKENLISEVLLLEGFPLTSKIKIQEDFLQNQIYRVIAPEFCTHSLFMCLDEQVHPNTVALLKMEKEDIFICLDSALSDELKATLQDRFNVHVI
jgi:adenine-specific DNA-methyltransferase